MFRGPPRSTLNDPLFPYPTLFRSVDARVFDLIGRGTGKLVGGDIADAVAAGLDGVHLDGRQLLEDIGHVDQLRPVVLDVLPRGEVSVAAIVAARNMGELA